MSGILDRVLEERHALIMAIMPVVLDREFGANAEAREANLVRLHKVYRDMLDGFAKIEVTK
jgi:hypothetical protein